MIMYAPSEVTGTESASAAIAVVVDIAGKTDLHCRHLAKTRCHLSEGNSHRRRRCRGCKSTRALDARRKIHIQNIVWIPWCSLSCLACCPHTLVSLWQLASAIILPQQPMAQDLIESKPCLFANSTLTLPKSRKTVLPTAFAPTILPLTPSLSQSVSKLNEKLLETM